MTQAEITPPANNPSSPEAVGEGIQQLVDETFVRLQPQVQRYAKDERRITSYGAAILSFNDSMIFSNPRHGRLVLGIANKDSRLAVAKVLATNPSFARASTSDYHSHKELAEGQYQDRPVGDVLRQDSRYKLLGGSISFFVSRELRASSRENPNPDEEKHKIGVKVVSVYEDPVDPSRHTQWAFSQALKSRDDRIDEPLISSVSEFDGLVDTKDLRYGSPFRPRLEHTLPAAYRDLEFMRNLLLAAKDLRPKVRPIKKHVKEYGAISRMFSSLGLPDDEPTPS
jgi:hypothetical protein